MACIWMFSPLLSFVADLEDTREVGHQNIAGCAEGSRELAKLYWRIICWDGILEHQFDQRLESFAPCYSQILKKTILYYGFKNPRNKKTWVYSWIAFCRTENEGIENSSLKRLEFHGQKPLLKMSFKNSISQLTETFLANKTNSKLTEGKL